MTGALEQRYDAAKRAQGPTTDAATGRPDVVSGSSM